MSDRCHYFDNVPAQLQPIQCEKAAIWKGLCYDHATRKFGEEWIEKWNVAR